MQTELSNKLNYQDNKKESSFQHIYIYYGTYIYMLVQKIRVGKILKSFNVLKNSNIVKYDYNLK